MLFLMLLPLLKMIVLATATSPTRYMHTHTLRPCTVFSFASMFLHFRCNISSSCSIHPIVVPMILPCFFSLISCVLVLFPLLNFSPVFPWRLLIDGWSQSKAFIFLLLNRTSYSFSGKRNRQAFLFMSSCKFHKNFGPLV